MTEPVLLTVWASQLHPGDVVITRAHPTGARIDWVEEIDGGMIAAAARGAIMLFDHRQELEVVVR